MQQPRFSAIFGVPLFINACLEREVFEGEPYFLYEYEKGKFSVVRVIEPSLDGRGILLPDGDDENYELGYNLKRMRCNELCYAEVLKRDYLPFLVNALRDFARKRKADFVAYESCSDNSIGEWFDSRKNPGIGIIAAKPRLFKRRF